MSLDLTDDKLKLVKQQAITWANVDLDFVAGAIRNENNAAWYAKEFRE